MSSLSYLRSLTPLQLIRHNESRSLKTLNGLLNPYAEETLMNNVPLPKIEHQRPMKRQKNNEILTKNYHDAIFSSYSINTIDDLFKNYVISNEQLNKIDVYINKKFLQGIICKIKEIVSERFFETSVLTNDEKKHVEQLQKISANITNLFFASISKTFNWTNKGSPQTFKYSLFKEVTLTHQRICLLTDWIIGKGEQCYEVRFFDHMDYYIGVGYLSKKQIGDSYNVFEVYQAYVSLSNLTKQCQDFIETFYEKTEHQGVTTKQSIDFIKTPENGIFQFICELILKWTLFRNATLLLFNTK